MLLQRLPSPAALLPTFVLVTSASACFVQPGQGSSDLTNNHPAFASLGQTVLEKKLVEFPLNDVQGNDISVGRLVIGVAREASGTLNFFYRFVNYTPDNIGLESIKVGGFDTVNTEIHTIQDDDHQTLPLAAGRSLDGSSLNFDFDPTLIEPGAKSLTLLVRTNATEYSDNGMIALDALGASRSTPESTYEFEEAQLRSFAPANAPMTVPLPAPVWTSLAGLAATVVYVLRHKQVF